MASIKKSEFGIIRRPRITEKTAIASAEGNCVVFEVQSTANKIEIRRAVEKIFSVKVKEVRTSNLMGKKKRVGKQIGYTGSWKKAYVSLAEGSTIDFVEGL